MFNRKKEIEKLKFENESLKTAVSEVRQMNYRILDSFPSMLPYEIITRKVLLNSKYIPKLAISSDVFENGKYIILDENRTMSYDLPNPIQTLQEVVLPIIGFEYNIITIKQGRKKISEKFYLIGEIEKETTKENLK